MGEHLNDHDLALAADFLIEEKYEKLATHIRQHIEECEQCSTNLVELTDVLSEEETAPFSLEPPHLKQPRIAIAKNWLVAASIALAIGSGVLAFQYHFKYKRLSEIAHSETEYNDLLDQNRDLKNEKGALASQNDEYATHLKERDDSLAQLNANLIDKDRVIASLYAPNPGLEEEMKLVLRSGSIDLKSPQKRIYTKKGNLHFEWEATPKSLGLAVYNNHGMRVQTIPTIAKGFELPLAKFGLGMYYYELYLENDLVAINSFEIH